MGEQTTLLDDVAHVTAQIWPFELLRRSPVDVDNAAARVVEAVDQFEQGRLAAAGRTNENNELARLDGQRDIDDGGPCLIPVVKPLADLVEPDLGCGARRAGKCLPLLLDSAPPLRETARRADGQSASRSVELSRASLTPDALRAAPLTDLHLF
jgi:hypothetical protein